MSKVELLKQQREDIKAKIRPKKLQDFLEAANNLREKLSPIYGIIEKVSPITALARRLNNVPKFKNNLPLYEYGLRLQEIQARIIAPETAKTIQSVRAMRERIEEIKREQTKAEDNLFYKMAIAEHELQRAADQRKANAEKQELQEKVKGLEITVNTLIALGYGQKQPKQTPARTLRPNITKSQILSLYENLKGIFEGSLEQWRALFSKKIQISEPIKAFAIADIALLLVQLYKHNLIKTKQYASIIGHVKAFSFEDIPVTAKQINATKERSDWWEEESPVIGLNYSQINKAVTSL